MHGASARVDRCGTSLLVKTGPAFTAKTYVVSLASARNFRKKKLASAKSVGRVGRSKRLFPPPPQKVTIQGPPSCAPEKDQNEVFHQDSRDEKGKHALDQQQQHDADEEDDDVAVAGLNLLPYRLRDPFVGRLGRRGA